MTVEEIIEKQKEFQVKLGNKLDAKEYNKEMFLGIICECVEALRETNWKNWQKDKSVKDEELTEELADVLLFYFNILLAHNISWSDIIRVTQLKQQKNLERQKNGY